MLPVIGVMAIICAPCQGTEHHRSVVVGEQGNGREKRSNRGRSIEQRSKLRVISKKDQVKGKIGLKLG